MSIPIVDLRAQFESIREETYAAVRRVFESQRFILGPEVEALENAVARLSRARHAIGCASGSDAIMLAIAVLLPPRRSPGPSALPALDGSKARFGERTPPAPRADRLAAAVSGAAASGSAVQAPGSAADVPEVLTVPFTFFASAGSVVHAGARPRFVDIEPDGFGMDPALVAGSITPRTIAVMPVHLFGQPCDLDEIARAAGAVPVVEDAAQAIGAQYGTAGSEARTAGSIGKLGCFSFFPTKNLGGAGDGGMIVTSDDALAERLRRMRVHGGRQMYHHESVGWNSRLDELQAAVLNVKLPRLAAWSEARAARAALYDRLLEEAGLVSRGLVRLPVRKPGRSHIFHQYVVRVPATHDGRDREGLRRHLASAGIATGVYYPVPLHLQECFRDLGHARGDFPVSEQAAEEVLALPIYPEIAREEQALVVREAAAYFRLA